MTGLFFSFSFSFLVLIFIIRVNKVQLQATVFPTSVQELLRGDSYLPEDKPAVLPERPEADTRLPTLPYARNRRRESFRSRPAMVLNISRALKPEALGAELQALRVHGRREAVALPVVRRGHRQALGNVSPTSIFGFFLLPSDYFETKTKGRRRR